MTCVVSTEAKTNDFFVVRGVGRIISCWSVGKIIIIIILGFRVDTSKNKNDPSSS